MILTVFPEIVFSSGLRCRASQMWYKNFSENSKLTPKRLSKIDEENQVFKILLTSSAIAKQAVNPGESIPIKFIKLGYPFSVSSLI